MGRAAFRRISRIASGSGNHDYTKLRDVLRHAADDMRVTAPSHIQVSQLQANEEHSLIEKLSGRDSGTFTEKERRLLYHALLAVSERKDLYAEQAHTDMLTGLLNRKGLTVAAEREFARLARNMPGLEMAVVYMDLDRFKIINDRLGHKAGDRALQRFAESVKTAMRDTDIVARLGGDEFCGILPYDLTTGNRPTYDILRQRIDEILKNEVLWDGGEPLPLSASIGICTSEEDLSAFEPQADNLWEKMLLCADARLYEDKEAAGQRVESLKAGVLLSHDDAAPANVNG